MLTGVLRCGSIVVGLVGDGLWFESLLLGAGHGAYLLRDFARYADTVGHRGPLRTELAVRWALASRSGEPAQAVRRLGAVRQVARYRALLDPATSFGLRYLHVAALIAMPLQWAVPESHAAPRGRVPVRDRPGPGASARPGPLGMCSPVPLARSGVEHKSAESNVWGRPGRTTRRPRTVRVVWWRS